MEWEAAAVSEFLGLPLVDSAKVNARIFAEKMARQNGSATVTPRELEQTKAVYFGKVPETVRRREYEKRVAAGETELWERMECAAQQILESPANYLR